MDEQTALAILESIAHILGKDAKYNLSHASMLAVDLGRELDNYMSHEMVAKFFEMFQAAKVREAQR